MEVTVQVLVNEQEQVLRASRRQGNKRKAPIAPTTSIWSTSCKRHRRTEDDSPRHETTHISAMQTLNGLSESLNHTRPRSDLDSNASSMDRPTPEVRAWQCPRSPSAPPMHYGLGSRSVPGSQRGTATPDEGACRMPGNLPEHHARYKNLALGSHKSLLKMWILLTTGAYR